jgi:hypothetical protein
MSSVEITPEVRRSRRDPTRSAGIRQHGRAQVNHRIFELHSNLRINLQEQDIFGLRIKEQPESIFAWLESNAQKLGRAEPMLQNMVETALATPPDWLRETITMAVERGIAQAFKELSKLDFEIDAVDPSETNEFHSTKAANEVQGISWETRRRLLRHVGKAIETRQRPTELMREIRLSLEKITRRRLILLVNTAVVGAINAGKLLTYRAHDVEMVGIEPEWLPDNRARRYHPVADHYHPRRVGIWRDAELVNVLTAGDDSVCEDCEDIAGDGPYTLDEAQGLIPAHPNCRCAFVPLGDRRYAESMERLERIREEEDDE